MVVLWHLDKDRIPSGIVDDVIELVWTERYGLVGEFIMVVPTQYDSIDRYQIGDYLYLNVTQLDGFQGVMIIETIFVSSSPDTGPLMTVRGRSLESILDRRIVWEATDLETDPITMIEALVSDSVGPTAEVGRQIPGFVIDTNSVTIELEEAYQYWGENVLDSILALFKEHKIGCRFTANMAEIKMELYRGVDRSGTQTARPMVIFSPEYDNLGESEYISSQNTLSNVALVIGEGEGTARLSTTIADSEYSGMARREASIDGASISKTVDSGELTDAEYIKRLATYGTEELAKDEQTDAFTASVDFFGSFSYNRDYFLGDVVSLETEYGLSKKVRISEIVYTIDTSGINISPTFIVEEED